MNTKNKTKKAKTPTQRSRFFLLPSDRVATQSPSVSLVATLLLLVIFLANESKLFMDSKNLD